LLREIFRFEWRYHTRQASFPAAVALFLLFGFVLAATGFGPDNVHINSPYAIAESTGLLSLLSVFILALFSANAVIRDREFRMEEIVFSTSVEKLHFLLGRFSGALAAALIAFAASSIGMILGRLKPGHDPARLASIDVLDYLYAFAVIAFPNILFAAVVIFAVAVITRSLLACYAASVVLYVLYFIASALTNSPLMAASAPGAEGSALAALLDPFALSAFFEQTQYWTAAERNARMVSLSGNFLLNRLIWTGASLVGLAIVYRLFSFRLLPREGKRKKGSDAESTPVAPSTLFPVAPVANPLEALLSATRMEIRSTMASLPFLALLLLWAGLAASEIIADISGGELGTSFVPTTALIAATIRQPLSLIGMILLIYFSAEAVWRERGVRFDGIVNATPSSNTTFILSKWIALSLLAAILTAVAFTVGVVVQITRGYPIEPTVIAAFVALNLFPLILFAAVAILIATLSPQKHLGMILTLIFAILAQRGELIGLAHPLFRFLTAEGMAWSAFDGFGAVLGRWRWLAVWWSSIAAIALLVAMARWRRESPRWRLSPLILAFSAMLLSGGFIFYNTNILNDYETDEQRLDWKADYEKRYESFATLARPRVRAVTASIDLVPETGSYRVRGEYQLVNEAAGPIDTIIVGVRRDATRSTMQLDRAASIEEDDRFSHRIFRLAAPLGAGESTRLHYDIAYDRRGFAAIDGDAVILENGSWIMSFRSLPSVGYRTSYEIEDPRERKRRGLRPLARPADESAEIAVGDWSRFDVTVSTAPDQTVVAPGDLRRRWKEAGRAKFHFVSERPIPNQFAIASARYAVTRRRVGDVDVEFFHHPDHSLNAARIVEASADSLKLFSARFGAYPHRHLRVAEIPSRWGFGGFAQPGVVFLQEQRGVMLDGREAERFDLLYRRVAHEVAHQWWGHQLAASEAPGASVLTESLTKYSELLALQRARGIEQVRRSLAADHDLYLSARTEEIGVEPPLSKTAGQDYLYYRKGAVVMWGLRDLLGEERLDRALRDLLAREGGPDGSPRIDHLLESLDRVSSPAERSSIDDWMNRVLIYDLKVISASAARRADGKFDVVVRVEASKGKDPLSEAIAVGLFADDEETLIALARPRIRTGANEVRLTVDKRPAVATIDPYFTRIDRTRFDNTREVK
jgi:ABC-2 type transport system permease protein